MLGDPVAQDIQDAIRGCSAYYELFVAHAFRVVKSCAEKTHIELMEVAKIQIWYEITHRTFMCNKRNDAYIDFQI